MEAELARIWAEVLDVPVESIDSGANFFSLGGDSVSILRVADEVAGRFFSDKPDDAPGIAEYFAHGTLAALARRLSPGSQPGVTNGAATQQPNERSVAIIGMACRFPGAASTAEFWRALCEGAEAVRVFSDEELERSGVSAADLRHPGYVKAGALLEGVRLFDADYFGMTPAEAALTSPEQRLLLECAEEALQDAGYGNDNRTARIGVFAGTGLSSYLLEMLRPPGVELESSRGMAVLASNTSAATRVSFLLDLTGPSVSIDTACSSSLVAVHMACQAILGGECAMALAGGATVRRFGAAGYLAETGGIFSPDGHCRPFDAHAQGTVVSSGAGMILLKSLSAAIADGDCIRAVIRGSAINNDGGTKAGYTAPSPDGQARVIRSACAAAQVDAASIQYVETHGTATALGDAIELSALAGVFRPTGHEKPVILGALKANVGHMEAAAGIGGLIKTALVLRHRQIPPAINFRSWHPALGQPGFELNSRLMDLAAAPRPLRAGVSSFGIGGTNAHAVLEEAPPSAAPIEPNRDAQQLLVVSARTAAALRESCQRLARWLEAEPAGGLADVAHTLQVGRKHFSHRAHVVATTVEEAARLLAAIASGTVSSPSQAAQVVFEFPDWNGQSVDGLERVYESEARFRAHMKECGTLLRKCLGRNPVESWRAGGSFLESDEEREPWLFAIAYSLCQLWRSWGVEPAKVIGYGRGECVAACVAGQFSLEDGLKLALARARFPEVTEVANDTSAGRATPPGILLRMGPLSPPGKRTDEYGGLMRALGQAWERGAPVDWYAFNASRTVRRVPLPAYPFERREHWFGSSPSGTPAAQEGQSLALSQWFNSPVWRQTPPQPSFEPIPGEPTCCVVVGKWSALESAIRERLTCAGTRVVCVPSSHSIAGMFDTLERERTPVSLVVHCTEGIDIASVEERPDASTLEPGVCGLLDLFAALRALQRKPTKLAVVTRGAHSLVGETSASPRRAMLGAMTEVFAKEFPDMVCQSIDIAPERPGLDALVSEIIGRSCERAIALRGGRRWLRAYCRTPLPGAEENAPLLQLRGAYLITGGMGGIGWTLADFLARNLRARLILTGRSAFPPREQWPAILAARSTEDPVCRRIREIQELEAAGARVLVVTANVCSLEAMHEAVALAVREFGRVDGVIHAAGVGGGGALHEVTRESLGAVVAPKVLGTWTLYEACRALEPDFFVCCSSIATVIAPTGWFEYCAANAYQDAFCEALDGTARTRFLSINWDRWREVGMAAAMMQRSAPGLSPPEGVEVFRRLLGLPGARWVISTRDLEGLLSSAIDPVPEPEATVKSDAPAAIEAELARVWKELLGIEQVATSDDFFDLGGDSLLAIDLHSSLESRFGTTAPSLRELMAAPEFGSMTQLVVGKVS